MVVPSTFKPLPPARVHVVEGQDWIGSYYARNECTGTLLGVSRVCEWAPFVWVLIDDANDPVPFYPDELVLDVAGLLGHQLGGGASHSPSDAPPPSWFEEDIE